MILVPRGLWRPLRPSLITSTRGEHPTLLSQHHSAAADTTTLLLIKCHSCLHRWHHRDANYIIPSPQLPHYLISTLTKVRHAPHAPQHLVVVESGVFVVWFVSSCSAGEPRDTCDAQPVTLTQLMECQTLLHKFRRQTLPPPPTRFPTF